MGMGDHSTAVSKLPHSACQYGGRILGTQGKAELSGFLTWSIHPAPHRRRTYARHIAGCQQQLRLVGFQPFGRCIAFRPPAKPALGEPFLQKPVSLAIVGEKANRGSPAASEDEHTPGEWVFAEFFLAELR